MLSPDRIREFLKGSEGIDFRGKDRTSVYQWIEGTLRRYQYQKQSKEIRGLLLEFLIKTTGLSQPQVKRLVGRYLAEGQVREKQYQRRRFARLYSKRDIELLAKVDIGFGRMSGPATKHILERECRVFGKREYAQLAKISVSHLYNLRKSVTYRRRAVVMGQTKPAGVDIAERRPPQPDGRPGYIRIDTVHQPERDGVKSVYHINAVDEVTQWEVVACVPKISEHYLVPVVEQILEQFPFHVRGFHSDNGSEYINHTVKELMEKLRVEFTKSRPHRSNDNGLAETKNGAVVRKNIGYDWLPPSHADDIHQFYRDWLNPYLNYHRPCGFPSVTTDAKGKRKKVYKTYLTPFERFRKIPEAETFLKPGMSWKALEELANADSDLAFAEKMQAARAELFRLCAQTAASDPPLVDTPERRKGGRV